MPHLMIQNGNGEPHRHELEGEKITIGRHPENNLVLDDGSISSHHAEIFRMESGWVVRDLGSSNGTRLNGEAIQKAAVNDGDTITFGGVETRFLQDSPAPAKDPESQVAPVPENEPPPAVKNEVNNLKSISSSFRHTVAKVATQIGVAARLAALKAKIEKLKRIDLNAAYYALGKKCYDLGLHREQFTQQFAAIAALEKQIEEKSKAIPVAENETTGDKMKRTGAKALAETEAAALKLKLRHRLIELGKAVMDGSSDDAALEEAKAAIAHVKEAIYTDEAAVAELGMQLKGNGLSNPIRRPHLIGVAVVLLVSLLSWAYLRHHTIGISYAAPGLTVPTPKALSINTVYANAGGYFDKPVVVTGIIHSTGNYGGEYEHDEESYYVFNIESDPESDSSLKVYLKRDVGPALFEAVMASGDKGLKGAFVVCINRHTKSPIGYTFKNEFWHYAECELLAYGNSVGGIRTLMGQGASSSNTGNEPHSPAQGLNVSVATLQQHLSSLSFHSPSFLGADTIQATNADGSVMALMRGPSANLTWVQFGIRLDKEDASSSRGRVGIQGEIAEVICGRAGREWVLQQLSNGNGRATQRIGSVVVEYECEDNQTHEAPDAPRAFEKPLAIIATVTFTPTK
jgi:hypothetical protein